MTGGAFTPLSQEFVASVPCPCLEKPFDVRQLDDAITRAMNSR